MSRLQKIFLMRGLPGSGKSTKSQEMLAANQQAIRVNKDKLREMLCFGKYTPKIEGMVVEQERAITRAALSKGYDVIVDDTNLNPVHYEAFSTIAASCGAAIEIVYVNVPLDECIRRDKLRGQSGGMYVGADAIKNMGFQFGVLKQEKPYAIFDMDGTLADCKHRQHFVRKPEGADDTWKKDWPSFNKNCVSDPPRQEVVDRLLDHWGQGHEIVICSGRSDEFRPQTEAWLIEHKIPWDRLIMRKAGDSREDSIVKQEFLDHYLDKTKCLEVYDDRPSVIRMWEKNGLKVHNVGEGVEF